MKAWARGLALGLLLAAALPPLAVRAADPAQKVLLDKANFWRLKHRPDLAIDALNQLLLIAPDQPDALFQYGMIEAQQRNIPLAQHYLARLRAINSADPHLADLENAIRAAEVNPGQLNEARRLAQKGELAQAAREYRQTFKGAPPPAYGVEYYLTLAGTAQGWDDARRGIEGLLKTAPGDPKIELALAQVLTYRQPTRAKGIDDLAALSKNPIVGADAVRAWRQALMWLGASPNDRQLYDAYLAQYPQDAEVRQHMADALRNAATSGIGGQQALGYSYLRRGKTSAAESAFAAALRAHPGDPDALAGLGIIRLRQQRFVAARDLLGRAIHAAPSRRESWQAAYDTAVFWTRLQEAKAESAARRYGRARTILAELVRQRRSDGWNAELLLGDVDAKLGDNAAAETAYRHVLAVRPRDAAAMVGLYDALTAQGKTAEAAALQQRVEALGPGRIAGVKRAQAELLRADAKTAASRGDTADALAKFQEAVATDPGDPWVRLDFARFLAQQGEPAQAFAMVDPATAGDTPAALYAAAIFDSEQNRFAEAQAKLDRIPAATRTPAMTAFRERILVSAQIGRAKELAGAGNAAEARNLLIALYSQPPMSAQKTRLVADALADIGDSGRALELLREIIARGGPGSASATIAYAGLLFRSGRDAEAGAYVARLQAQGRLGTADVRELEQLKAQIAAERADSLRQRGDYADAYDQISPMLTAYPNDPSLLLAAGRIYAAAGRDSEAMRFFDAAYRQSPGDVNIIRGAVGGAIVAHDYARARAYLAQGMRLYPHNARLYFLEGELARAEGDPATAISALRTARALDIRQTGAPAAPLLGGTPSGRTPLPPNPFRQSKLTPPPPTPAVSVASDAPPAPLPTDLQLAAIPADSEDLIVPPHARERPQMQPAPIGKNGAAPAMFGPLGSASAPRPAAEGAVFPDPTGQSQLAQLEPLPPPPIAGYRAPQSSGAIPSPQGSLALDIERSMRAIEAQNNPMMQGGLSLRYRDGEPGLSRLVDVGVPIEGSFSPFYTGRMRLSATPTFLSAGTPGGATGATFGSLVGASAGSALTRFGSNPAFVALSDRFPQTPLMGYPVGSQDASGVAFSVGYSYRNIDAEVGTTPLGFRVANFTGRLMLAWPGDAGSYPDVNYSNQYSARVPRAIALAPEGTPANPFQLRFEGQRQPITDSLLSYAGAKDPGTGIVWGGVVKTGGDILASYDDGEVGFYGTAGGGALDGQHVASNTELEADVGGFVRPYRSGRNSFKVGVNLTYLNFDKNLDFYSLGQGGYFSPQNYINFSVPLEFSGQSGRLTYLLGGSLGIQTFDQKSSPVFPDDPGRQAALQALWPPAAFYPANSVTGVAFGARGQIEYQLNNGFAVGGLASVNNAQNYTEGIAKIYLRKTFGLPAAPTGVLPGTHPGNL